MGNILINVKTGNGFLNDWDLCKYKEELEGPHSQSERVVSLTPEVRLPDTYY